MSLSRTTRRSGLMLIVLGVAGGLFFWATDPTYGPTVAQGTRPVYDPRAWLAALRGNPTNVIDAAHEASVATGVGFAGSAFVFLVGGWLVTRRTV